MDTFLRNHRLRRDIRPTDLARTVGVHPTSILRWERRERLPGPVHIRQLAHALDLDPAAVAAFFDAARVSSRHDGNGVRGRGLRAVRRSAGVSAATIARSLGVRVATVYNWEAGRARIPDGALEQLGRVLGLTADRLLDRIAVAPPEPEPPTPGPLRMLRLRSRLTQERAATVAGVHRHSLGAWERGEGTPPLAAVRRLARAYGRSVTEVAAAAGVEPPPLLDPRRWRPGDLPGVLRTLRAWTGLTQRELAGRCGCSVATVRAWEAGRAAPRASSRSLLEAVFGLPPDSLRSTVGPERPAAGGSLGLSGRSCHPGRPAPNTQAMRER